MSKDALSEYKKKRDFKQTKEPKGRKKQSKGEPIFVIQGHDATRLHFDFRLEIEGVLKSWAVPKGPSNEPSVKRLAIETEDHPLDYATFHGTIPEGNYGAGKVVVWDKGIFKNQKEGKISLKKQYDRGEILVWLEGKKVKGGYALVRTEGKGPKAQWLLIKRKDEYAA